MIDSLATQKSARASSGVKLAVSRPHLVELLVGLGRLAIERPDVASVDVNPLDRRHADGVPIAVDALVEIGSRPCERSCRSAHDRVAQP